MGDKDPKTKARLERLRQEKKNGGDNSTQAEVPPSTHERPDIAPSQKKGIPPDALKKGDRTRINAIMREKHCSEKDAIATLKRERRTGK